MVLNMTGQLFGNGIFQQSPEDDQVSSFQGPRIIPTDQTDTVTITPLEDALNVLELQIATAITPGNYKGLRMDLFTDADGNLNTIETDGALTTATFDTDLYKVNSTTAETYPVAIPTDTDDSDNFTINATANFSGYLSSIRMEVISTVWDYIVSIVQDGDTLATKTLTVANDGTTTFTFAEGDYTRLIKKGAFQITIVSTPDTGATTSAQIETNTGESHSDAAWSFSSQEIPAYDSGTSADGIVFKTVLRDESVQTIPITILSGYKNFQITAFRQTTTGAGTVTADVSFDNGVTWQTDLAINQNHTIENPGTELIVKINLNKNASAAAEASSKGWGIQLW